MDAGNIDKRARQVGNRMPFAAQSANGAQI